MPCKITFKNSLIIHKEKKKKLMFNECLYILYRHRQTLGPIFYTKIIPNLNISARMSWSIWDFAEAVQKTRNHVLSGVNTLDFASSL